MAVFFVWTSAKELKVMLTEYGVEDCGGEGDPVLELDGGDVIMRSWPPHNPLEYSFSL